MLKSTPPRELVDAIRHVHTGRKNIAIPIATQLMEHYDDEPLTNREVEVLRHLTSGRTS
jgi:DNA-binding NarL/FixJ family response regulator